MFASEERLRGAGLWRDLDYKRRGHFLSLAVPGLSLSLLLMFLYINDSFSKEKEFLWGITLTIVKTPPPPSVWKIKYVWRQTYFSLLMMVKLKEEALYKPESCFKRVAGGGWADITWLLSFPLTDCLGLFASRGDLHPCHCWEFPWRCRHLYLLSHKWLRLSDQHCTACYNLRYVGIKHTWALLPGVWVVS